MTEFGDDERAVSESAGVAILVGITVLVTLLVGLNVLIATQTDTSGPNANFTYDHVGSNAALIITHVRGDEFPAGKLVIEGEEAKTTWAAAARINETQKVGPGDIVQIHRDNSYGEPVSTGSKIRVFYERKENRTKLSEWP